MRIPEWVYEKKNRFRRIVTHAARRVSGRPRIVASLTSYPPRIGAVNVAIQSLLAQHFLPDLIVLWLYEGDFPNGEQDLPPQLRHQLAHDVQVRWVNRDLKPYKKYFWAMQEFPDDILITFDDDLVYRNTLIAELMASYSEHPHAISAARTHLITFDEAGSRRPYEQWVYEIGHWHPEVVGIPSHQLFATTGAGALFPPHLLPSEALDVDAFSRLCPIADDIWLKCMQLAADIPVVAATADQLLDYLPGSQEVALCHQNVDRGANDRQLDVALEYCEGAFGLDLAKLMHDESLEARIH